MIDAFITNKKEYFSKTIECEPLTNAVNFAGLGNEKSMFCQVCQNILFSKTLLGTISGNTNKEDSVTILTLSVYFLKRI